MNTENPHYSLSLLCETLEVSRSGCSQWAAGKADAREKADETLKQKVRESFDASRQSYGYRHVHADLQAAGNRVTQQRVARLMREEHLQGRRKRRYNPRTTQSDPRCPHRPKPPATRRKARRVRSSMSQRNWRRLPVASAFDPPAHDHEDGAQGVDAQASPDLAISAGAIARDRLAQSGSPGLDAGQGGAAGGVS